MCNTKNVYKKIQDENILGKKKVNYDILFLFVFLISRILIIWIFSTWNRIRCCAKSTIFYWSEDQGQWGN